LSGGSENDKVLREKNEINVPCGTWALSVIKDVWQGRKRKTG